LFWDIWNKNEMKFPEDRKYCYIFEMVTPRFPIVVRTNEERITLHGCRNIKTLKEVDPVKIASKNNWPCCPIYPFTNLTEIIEASKNLNPIESEGYVVCDKDFHRIKIKAPQYVALAHLQMKDSTGLNYKKMIQIVRMHEGSEFLTYYPQHRTLYNVIHEIYKEMKRKIKEVQSAIALDIMKSSIDFIDEIIIQYYPDATQLFCKTLKDIIEGNHQSVDDYLKDVELMDIIELSSQFISPQNQYILDELQATVPKRKKKKKFQNDDSEEEHHTVKFKHKMNGISQPEDNQQGKNQTKNRGKAKQKGKKQIPAGDTEKMTDIQFERYIASLEKNENVSNRVQAPKKKNQNQTKQKGKGGKGGKGGKKGRR